MNYIDVFSNLGFNFNVDLKLKPFEIEKNSALTERLKNSVFYYKSPNNTNTSFYLITIFLEDSEIKLIRKYIWNKNDADLIFYYPHDDKELIMMYAKYSPKVEYKDSILDKFLTSQKDLDKIEVIKHWKFDSGVFWLNYHSFIDKAKYRGIDKELISTLKSLKEQLFINLSSLIIDENKRNEIVQALIDRTLYIKYLEDNHIINFHFYGHYFNDINLNYEKLLENNSGSDLNKLFKKIHEIFNNSLFDQPTIEEKFLTIDVRNLISTSFKANLDTGQLRLFDFQFDVLPVEFISYIYEVFLSDKQKENGIYYTPKKLAQLIIDEVINEDQIGSILDPSSGSGMFLIVGYQRLLEIAKKQNLEPLDSIEKIKFRTKLLSENIFGIEKEITAQRFTLFSLSLQIFTGIEPTDIKDFIANELKENKKINLFSEYSFFENIKHANSLNIYEEPFKDKCFSYLVGNPPFFEIPDTNEYKNEVDFLNFYKVKVKDDNEVIAKNIIGRSQISQSFFLKIKDWSDINTRFGFVSNSSNFYNDYSENFQEYFYSNYGIEKLYELSRVKDILFEKAKESVVAIIFTNNYNDNLISYYPVDLGLFSDKPFELLIIQEDKVVNIEQKKLISKGLRLRDFLVGNDFDRNLISKMSSNLPMGTYLNSVHRGFEIWGEDARKKEFNLSKEDWRKTTDIEKTEYLKKFIEKYFNAYYSKQYNKPYIKPANLKPFIKIPSNQFISSIDNFHRPRINKEIYIGEKLIFTRIGSKLNCVFSKDDDYFDFSVYTVKLKDNGYYNLFQAILNSWTIQFYLDFYLRKRVFDSFSRIGNDDILNIPIPKEIDQDLASEIAAISENLSNGKFDYIEKESELNELVFDLYELSYWEKQRIRDYFLPKQRIGRKINQLHSYKISINEIISFYLKNEIIIEETTTDFNLKVVKISLNNYSNSPDSDKVKKYILNEIFEQNPNGNFLASQEKIYGTDCVYIIKEDINKNWTETKAFEDGQDILKHILNIK
ncbi:N-6 DNA methylase [Chryseobacterium flavum]|uniref:N-6 DNA methylase n=1 Tax=Chryseobacterium flavum TaxID=415851 RepID=UPI002FD97511